MELFSQLGFSAQDVILLKLCPLFSVLGGLVHFVLLDVNFERLPSGGGWHTRSAVMGRIKWTLGRVFISAVLGIIFALYFVGALTEGPTTVARILAFAVVVGYMAPKLWSTQEKLLLSAMEKRVGELVDQHLTSKSSGQ